MLKTFATGSRERFVDMKEDINGKAYHNIASKGQFLSLCAPTLMVMVEIS